MYLHCTLPVLHYMRHQPQVVFDQLVPGGHVSGPGLLQQHLLLLRLQRPGKGAAGVPSQRKEIP